MVKAKQASRRKWPPSATVLDGLIDEVIVDAYGDSEQRTGFHAMFDRHLALPFEVEILGVTATVERVDMDDNEQIVAVCRRGRARQSIPILDPSVTKTATRRGRMAGSIPSLGAG
jgi:hypothetical protein